MRCNPFQTLRHCVPPPSLHLQTISRREHRHLRPHFKSSNKSRSSRPKSGAEHQSVAQRHAQYSSKTARQPHAYGTRCCSVATSRDTHRGSHAPREGERNKCAETGISRERTRVHGIRLRACVYTYSPRGNVCPYCPAWTREWETTELRAFRLIF